MKRGFDSAGLSPTHAYAEQARRDHTGVVEDQRVAGTQQQRQVGDDVVSQGAGRVHLEQARRVARTKRAQCDVRIRQIEIEVVEVHPGLAYAIGAGAKTVIRSAMDLFRAAILIMAAAPALLALLSLGGVFSERLDVLTHFTPLYTITGLLGAALAWAAGPPDRLAIALGLIAVLTTGALMAPEWAARLARRGTGTETARLKLIQFNLWYVNQDPIGTARWIESEQPDVLVVEEAVQAGAAVIDALGASLPFRSFRVDGKRCPILIMSRFRMIDCGDLADIESLNFAGGWARIDDGNAPFVVVGLHLTWPVPPRAHQAQSRRASARLAAFDRTSLIVAGDFNATPWSFALRRQDVRFGIPRLTRALATWPAASTQWGFTAPVPFLPIDHIYAGPAWRLISLRRGPRLGSDHHPVVAVLARKQR
jgi:endonuclease/exonuclease/phosphatase (EEP) superfamily protein YafD